MSVENVSPAGGQYARTVSPAVDTQRRLARVRRLATLMDQAVRVPGTRFRVGLDGLAGLVPVAGDVATGLVAAYIIYEARQLGAPTRLQLRMLANLGLDVVLGAVPLVGDVFDMVWKGNWRNLRLLERHLEVH